MPLPWLKRITHTALVNTMEKLPVWPNSRIDELLPLKTAFSKSGFW
jgi:hypothetical protein